MKTILIATALLTLTSAAQAQFAEPMPARGEDSRCWQWLPDDETHIYTCPRTPASQSFVRGTKDEAMNTAIARDAALRKSWSYQYPAYQTYRWWSYSSTRTYRR